MQIILKNHHHFTNKAKRIVTSSDKDLKEVFLNDNIKLNSPDLQSLIHLLNNSTILNPFPQTNLMINFEDFTIWNKLIVNQTNYVKNKLNKWIDTNFITHEGSAFYNKEDTTIYIKEYFFNKLKRDGISFNHQLNRKINQTDLLNFSILHEIGHAFNHQYYIINKKQLSTISPLSHLINQTVSIYGEVDLFKDIGNQSPNIFRNKDLNSMNSYAVSEGFADLYACIAMSFIYPRDKAIHIIESVIESRKKADEFYEFYYSHPSIELFINDLKDNQIHFNNFNDIYDYMSAIIEKTIKNNIENQLLKFSPEEVKLNHRYLGFISKILNINQNNIINELNQNYGLNIVEQILIEKEVKEGAKLYEKNKEMFHSDKILQEVKFNIENIRAKILDKVHTRFNKNSL